jgi:hypothetical protein
MSLDADKLLSSGRIVCDPDDYRGSLEPLPVTAQRPGAEGRLKGVKNRVGRRYEENHLEQWVARNPELVFPNRRVLLLASQNHVHLPVKVDLLFVDDAWEYHIVELKVIEIARNGGESPYQVYNVQMKKYVTFLTNLLREFPRSVESYYSKLPGELARNRKPLRLALEDAFGSAPVPSAQRPVVIHEVYLAAGYDDDARRYIAEKSRQDGRSARLVYFKYFPGVEAIEFWQAGNL